MEELAHSFNIVLDRKISAEIKTVQKKVSSKITERHNYGSSPHLAIATKFMEAGKSNLFVAELLNEFSKEEIFEITFAGFQQSETGNYIFLNLDSKSRRKLFSLSRRAFRVTKKVGFEEHSGLAPKYPYDPHVSIIKLGTEEIDTALKLIDEDLAGTRMRVKALEITREKVNSNGFGEFPAISQIKLRG